MPDSDWIDRPAMGIPTHVNPNTYLGEEDASAEWTRARQPVDIFLHTESYDYFSKESMSYVFGRRGTGKTTILQMLHYEIRHGLMPPYGVSWLINDEDTYLSLTMQVRTSDLANYEDNELTLFLKNKWKWAFRVAAMQGVIWDIRHSDAAKTEDIETIEQFLFQIELLNRERMPCKLSALSKIVEISADELEAADVKSLKMAGVVTRIARRLETIDFSDADEALTRYLSGRNTHAAVLIDSIEEYNISDRISRCNISALIAAVAETYNVRDEKKVLVKVALPAEIYDHLTIWAHDKTGNRFLFIHWKQNDLTSFVAKRYYRRISSRKHRKSDEYKWKLKKLEDSRVARRFLYEHMPENCTTRQGVVLDTITYIVKHTQKKPRQLITILNAVLGRCEDAGESLKSISEQHINEGIHIRSDILVRDALDIYERLYRNAQRLAKRTFVQKRNVFTWPELDNWVQEVSDLRGSVDLSVDELKRFFIEAGILGREARRMNAGDIDYVEVDYEYQVKGNLTFSNDSNAVIHPLFYDEFESKVHRRSVLFPKPYEDEERAALVKAGFEPE